MLDSAKRAFCSLPDAPGVGYKQRHFTAILDDPGEVAWLEIHAENYMGDGGRPIAQLRRLAEDFPISLHGVALGIGSEGPLCQDHLSRLKRLAGWLDPASFSEHLAWSTHDTRYFSDLLPLPYTEETLSVVCEHIDEVQTAIGRRMLLENPSTYLAFEETTMPETDFLREIARRTGCGLLLDINNVFVSATNQGTDPVSFIDSFPLDLVGEIHLGGHEEDSDEEGAPLLIDSHGREVADPVWSLYEYAIRCGGPKPTLIEWDNHVPEWPVLAAEAARAAPVLQEALA